MGKLKSKLVRFYNNFIWTRDSRKIHVDLSKKESLSAFSSLGKVLVVAPHADDELIGCYGILKDYDATVFYTGLLGNDAGNSAVEETRKKELLKSCDNLQCKAVISEPDLWHTKLERLIECESFDSIFIPSVIDWHPEHRKVANDTLLILKSCNYSHKIYMYQVTVPLPSSVITHYKLLDDKGGKWNSFHDTYISQNFMPIARFKAAEREFSIHGKRYAAEPFWLLTDNDMAIIKSFKSESLEKELNSFKLSINNLKLIRNKSEAIFKLAEGMIN